MLELGGVSKTPRSISPPVPLPTGASAMLVPTVATNASGAAASAEEGIETLQIQGGQLSPPRLCKSRVAHAKAEPPSEKVAPDAGRGRGDVSCTVGGGRSSGPRARRRQEEEKIVPHRWNPQLRMVLVAKHPNLSLQFLSGVSSS
jgi:hypothetical protein